jgi:hypothetical protein
MHRHGASLNSEESALTIRQETRNLPDLFLQGQFMAVEFKDYYEVLGIARDA